MQLYAHLLITRILPLRGATLQRDTRYTRTTPTLAPPLDLPLLPRPLRPPPRCELTPFPRLSASPLRSAAAPLAAAACPSRSALSARLAAAATCSSRRGPSLRRARQGGPLSAGRHAQAHRLGLSCQYKMTALPCATSAHARLWLAHEAMGCGGSFSSFLFYSPPFPCLTVVGRERGARTSSTQIV